MFDGIVLWGLSLLILRSCLLHMAGKFDIIGIGDLNVDYIIGRTSCQTLEKAFPDKFRQLRAHFSSGHDRTASREKILELLDLSRGFNAACLGGSAFNVIQAAAGLKPELRLGCLGILASQQNRDADFAAWFDRHDVDRTFVLPVSGEQGSCASLFEIGKRLLLLHPATNGKFANVFAERGDSIVEHLCDSRIVHVTPLIDERAANLAAGWMHAIKARSPGLLLSLDPGYRWTESMSPALAGIYGLVDVLFINETELRQLAACRNRQPCKSIIEGLVAQQIISAPITVAIKADRDTYVYACDEHTVNESVYPIQDWLAEQQIEDTTGAGDVFAAGFLFGRFVQRLTLPASVDLAHRLMWRKLQGIGMTMSHSFAQDMPRAGAASQML